MNKQTKTYTVYFALDGFLGLFEDSQQPWTIGGAEIQMYYLASSLADLPNVNVILLYSNKASIPTISHPHIQTVEYRKPIDRGMPFVSRRYNREINDAQFGTQSDVSFFMATNNEPIWLLNEAKLNGIPVIFRINGDSLVDGMGLITEEAQARIDDYILTADGIVVQNINQQSALRSRYNRSSRMIPNSFNKKDVLRAKGGKCTSSAQDSVLWVGRVDAIKRPWIIAELARRLPDVQFVCALHNRGGDTLYRQTLYDLNILPNVRTHISLDPQDLVPLYREATLVINTSSTEGFPNTLIEASLAEKPYLSLEVDPSGLLSDGTLGLCAQGDNELFIRQIQSLLSDSKRQKTIGEQANKFAQDNWSIDKVTSQYLEYAEEVYVSKHQ